MCFRPADAGQSLNCPSCGKQINAIMGNWPLNCPFCNVDLKDAVAALNDSSAAPAPAAPAAPGAPAAPAAPSAPAAPKPPTAS